MHITRAAGRCYAQYLGLLISVSAAAFAQVSFIEITGMVFPNDITSNGLIVAGRSPSSADMRPVIWTRPTGVMRVLEPFYTIDQVNGDGTALAGTHTVGLRYAAYRWSGVSGVQTIALAPEGGYRYTVDGMSTDGDTVLLNLHDAAWTYTIPALWTEASNTLNYLTPGFTGTFLAGNGQTVGGTVNGEKTPAIWTNGGLELLARPEGTSLYHISGGSDDGRYLTGWASTATSGPIPRQAILWDRQGFSQLLGLLNDGLSTDALAVSNLGNLVVGRSTIGLNGFLWTPESGMRDFREVLAQSYGLADEMKDWVFLIPTALSGDGRYLAGYGANRQYGQISWFLDRGEVPPPILPPTPVPEPGTFGVIGMMIAFALGAARRLRKR